MLALLEKSLVSSIPLSQSRCLSAVSALHVRPFTSKIFQHLSGCLYPAFTFSADIRKRAAGLRQHIGQTSLGELGLAGRHTAAFDRTYGLHVHASSGELVHKMQLLCWLWPHLSKESF